MFFLIRERVKRIYFLRFVVVVVVRTLRECGWHGASVYRVIRYVKQSVIRGNFSMLRAI